MALLMDIASSCRALGCLPKAGALYDQDPLIVLGIRMIYQSQSEKEERESKKETEKARAQSRSSKSGSSRPRRPSRRRR